MDMDDLLPQVGEFGTYQKLMLWLVCLPACFPCGFGAFNQLFMASVPEHWCKVSKLLNFTKDEQRNISIPFTNTSFERCRRYAVNWTKILDENGGSLDGIEANSSWSTEVCKEGWVYDKSPGQSSIVIDVSIRK